MNSPEMVSTSPKTQCRRVDNGSEDRISCLPDSILCQILSVPPTKDAVATSILSPRWKHAWTSVRNLCFDDELSVMGDEVSGITVAAFEKFVHSVLARTHPSSVEKFSLRCSYLRSLGMFDYWVSSAISRNVREIEIDLRDHERIPLPASIYRSITLEVLRLRSYFALTIPPDGVCFPRLKTFHLMLQQPTNHLPHNLFSRCPCLQHLSLTVYFTAANPASNLIISSATLKTFVLEVMYCSHSSAPNQHTVTIVAPNLEFLDITDDLAVSYAVHQLPSLHKAVYYVMFSEWPPIDRRPPVQLLAGMTKTKCLTLSAGVLHALNRRGDNIFPQFSALTYLHVTVGQFGCTMLPTILGCSPNLHTFVLHLSDWYVLNDEQTRWTDTATVPSCLSDHVNIIEINGLGKENSHMRLAEYLLNHSRVLLTMTVRCKPSVDGKTLENLHHRLMGLHRGCASAFIHLTSIRPLQLLTLILLFSIIRYALYHIRMFATEPDTLRIHLFM
ncbi:F-box/FBD/LRR-repeat protein [Citrus sinensis]|uniref:F-box/FBD/LRR-repeat protein n=1 Tax=Citrus sinensis TaxID=2711 RepID=A0ACB8KLK4_CITSI|nr:F-box/FBD/LRR-repeat protein [Citrus sinensis]